MNEITVLITENNQFVLNILKNVLSIPHDLSYTMKPESTDSAFFMIYDNNGKEFTSFSIDYTDAVEEFNLSIGCIIYPFESYHYDQYLYEFNVILDIDLNYLRTELTFHASVETDSALIFIEDGSGIYVSYLSPPTQYEEFQLNSKKFITDLFQEESSFLTDLYTKNNSIFRIYSIADLIDAKTDSILINNMKQISDMAVI